MFSFKNLVLCHFNFTFHVVFENEKLKSCLITVDFSNENLDTIISIITQTLSISSKEENGKIILFGNGC